MQEELYRGREQALVKHALLQNYLAAFGHIIGLTYGSVTYVDCFSGPWRASSQHLEDTSFSVALGELKKARDTLRAIGKNLRIRCFFIEKNAKAYQQLESFASAAREPGIEIITRETRFEDAIPEIAAFLRKDPGSFPFVFIDPKGWKPIAINAILPLLEIRPGEVLINLMTSHLHRFVKMGNQAELFGGERYSAQLAGLSGMDLDDEMVSLYSDALRKHGNYDFVIPAIILRPEIDTPHYRLLYATRHPLGVEKFKEAERRAMDDMEATRANVKQRLRETRTHQPELFSGEVVDNPTFYRNLRLRYLTKSEAAVRTMLETRKKVSYDELWATAISLPLVFEGDLKSWLGAWSERIKIEGMAARERTPKRNRGHVIVWR